jgi:Fur family transcriptional regulator, ferric uptake regulator
MTETNNEFAVLLRSHGFKATPGRIKILNSLKKFNKPAKVDFIYDDLNGSVDRTTIYRTLDSLVEAGVVIKVDFGHSHAHYELADSNNHHHHLICDKCGVVEDVKISNDDALEKSALANSKSFAKIKTHSLEFFGLCHDCVGS